MALPSIPYLLLSWHEAGPIRHLRSNPNISTTKVPLDSRATVELVSVFPVAVFVWLFGTRRFTGRREARIPPGLGTLSQL